MKAHTLALALLLASPVAAEAGCSKANLNGNWVVLVSNGFGIKAAMNNGLMTLGFGSNLLKVNISALGANCKGQGSLTIIDLGPPLTSFQLPGTVRAEITPGSGKPNNVSLVVSLGIGSEILSMSRVP